MPRFLLRTLGIVGGMATLLVVAAAIALWTLDLDRLIEPLRAEVKALTGRDLAVRGGIGIAFRPGPVVILSEVSLANAPAGNGGPLATARRVEAQVALLPLLARRLDIARLEVIGPALAFEIDADGSGNWESAPAEAREHSAAAAADWRVGELMVRDGILDFRDARTGASTRATIDTLRLHAPDAAAPVRTEWRGSVGTAAIDVTGLLGPFEKLRSRQGPYAIDLAGKVAGRHASIASKLRREGGTYIFDELAAGYASNGFKGKVSVTPGGKRPKVSVYASAKSIRVADLPWIAAARSEVASGNAAAPPLLSRATMPLDALDATDFDLELETGAIFLREGWQFNRVNARIVVQDGQLDTPVLTARSFGGSVAARLRVDAGHQGSGSFALRVDARDIDLAALFHAVGVERQAAGARAAFTAELAGRGRSLHAWAASADGEALLSVEGGSIGAALRPSSSALGALVDALIPSAPMEPPAELLCAVVRLPLAGGVVVVDRSVAFEAAQARAYASGTIDLGAESVDLVFHTQSARRGRGEPEGEATPVRLAGTLADARVTLGSSTGAGDALRVREPMVTTQSRPAPRHALGSAAGLCALARKGTG